MSFDIERALRDGVDRATERNAVFAVALLFALRLTDRIVGDSFTERFLVEVVQYREILAEIRAEATQPVPDPFADSFPLALLDLPVEALGAVAFVLFVAGLVLDVGFIRTFTGEERDTLPVANFTRNLGWTLLRLVVGTVLYGLAVLVGLVLFVIPGIYLAVALFFFSYEIIVAEKGVLDAFGGSLDLTAGNRLPLFVLGFIFAVLGTVVSGTVGVVLPSTTVAGAVVQIVVSSAIAVLGLTVAARAYVQLRDANQEGIGE
jgi:hypothetical protein